MPSGFVPKEDRGIIFTDVALPPGASMERTYNVLKDLQAEARKIPGVANVTFTASRGFMSGSGSNAGQAFVRLKPFAERAKDNDQSVEAITKQLFGLAGKFPDAKIVFFSPPSIPGFGSSDGFSAVLLDKSGGSLKQLDGVAKEYLGLGACVVKDQRCSVAADFVKDGGNGIASAAACPRRRGLGFKHRDVGVGAGIGMDDVATAGYCREKVGDGSGVFHSCRKPDTAEAGA